MQAALMLRSKSRVARRRKLRKLGGRLELPSNVATKEIAPFPRYPPESWKNTYVTTPPAPQPEPPPPPPECAQGRAAWLERGRRCSVQEQQQQQATCHRRWVKRNRIQDASLGGSSDDEDFLGVLRGPSTFANAFLYVGLGTVALGLVIAFVGTGEKGFKTVELRLIGPSLIGLGLICCILRILFCICPSHCISSSKKARKKNGNKIDADHTTSLLRNESKRVSIARGPSIQPKYPIAHKRSQSKMLNEGMEALRQIATTSLFMQNEQKTAINRVVPIINEPESMDHMGADAPLEMKKLQTALNMCEMSDEEQEESVQLQQQTAKRATATIATTATSATKTTTTATTAVTSSTTKATTLTTVDERPNSKLLRQRVALQQQRQQSQQQLQLQQQQPQLEQSQSLSSSSTVRDSLDGVVIVEETSLMDTATPTVAATPMPPPIALPSSCSSGAIPRLKSSTATFSAARPGVSTGATPKTTPTTSNSNSNSSSNSSYSNNYNTRLTSSQSQPNSYDLPPALPHTYSATATVRGPLGMTLTGSSSAYGMPASRTATSTSTTTTISLLPLPAPPTAATATAAATEGATTSNIPGQVLESQSRLATTSLSILQPLHRPATAHSMTAATSSAAARTATSAGHKSQPSSASLAMGRGNQQLLLLPSKLEPELVLSPSKLGQ
ncbi:serine-rich adhesin for platelets isoform X2 [Drosophila hydei]|uniref:Serine-rich adhesin for platelets isoform X2 n=1 Tax=Drosophila hydei TaxID=7224 RepID=A0A6J1LB41_DROHY|nr:serine-rich adhesin for platelets isoform X2 [Drosophila hydei]